jgi:type II secretory pathway component PulF
METFTYKAVQANGEITEGTVDAQDTRAALALLASKQLKPLVLKSTKKGAKNRGSIFAKSINLEDKVFLTRYLALMLRVGTDLFKAVDILIEDFDKPAVRNLLIEIRSNLEEGRPFHTVFAKYPKSFSPVFVNLVKAGEVSGNLEGVFEKLSGSLESQHELRQKIKSSLTYPVILFAASVLILILLVSFSIPKIANVFLSGGIEPPGFSKVVFTVGLFIGGHLVLMLGGLVVLVVGGGFFLLKTALGQNIIYDIALRVPVVKRIIKQISLQNFASTLSSLLGSGISITEALNVTAGSIGMPELRTALVRISEEGIKKGLTVGEAFKKETVFPNVVANLIAVSEKSGNLEEILQTLADFYASEIESSVKSVVSFIEPIMLLFIGIVIGTIALAVIVPVYQLSTSF